VKVSLVLVTVLAALLACTAPPPVRLGTVLLTQDSLAVDGLLLRGRTVTHGAAGDTLLLSVELVNRGRDTLALEYGACTLEPRLLRPGATDSQPVYAFFSRPDSSMVPLRDGRLVALYFACPAYLARASVAPGATFSAVEFHYEAGLDSIAADSLHGAYNVVARIRLLGRYYDVPAGMLQLR
jgi:hypothetical protein